MPDAPLVLDGGRSSTLFEQIYNPDGCSWGWRLLLLDGGQKANHASLAAAAQALSAHDWVRPLLVIADPESSGESPLMTAAWDLDQNAHRVLGLAEKASILLARPDGHLAFRGDPADLPSLVKHVATFAATQFNQ